MDTISELRDIIKFFRKNPVKIHTRDIIGYIPVSFENVENFLYFNDDTFGIIFILVEVIPNIKIILEFNMWPDSSSQKTKACDETKFIISGKIISEDEYEKIKKIYRIFPQEVLLESGSSTKGVR